MGTAETILGGRVILRQLPRGGYRTNVDALLLAAFAARGRPARLVVDLGAGVGAVALTLLHLGAAARARLVEIDPAAAELARENLEANGWGARADVVCADVTSRSVRGEADLVVCNPPYARPGSGRPAKDPARARARAGPLDIFVGGARAALGPRGRACFVYPVHDLFAMMRALRDAGLEPKRLRFVHATSSAVARIALVEATPAKSGGLAVEPPLVERAGGAYTAELAALLDGLRP